MLIISRGVTQESIGRIVAIIDSIKKDVTLKSRDGSPLVASELIMMNKFLSYHHPEIINRNGLATGWTITGELDVT